jgi:hypothetical protein
LYGQFMNGPERPRRLAPRMTRGGFRGLFVVWTFMAVTQVAFLILRGMAGRGWDAGNYLSLATVVGAVAGIAYLLYVRRHDKHFWDEDEARRAEWDRRGRQL